MYSYLNSWTLNGYINLKSGLFFGVFSYYSDTFIVFILLNAYFPFLGHKLHQLLHMNWLYWILQWQIRNWNRLVHLWDRNGSNCVSFDDHRRKTFQLKENLKEPFEVTDSYWSEIQIRIRVRMGVRMKLELGWNEVESKFYDLRSALIASLSATKTKSWILALSQYASYGLEWIKTSIPPFFL